MNQGQDAAAAQEGEECRSLYPLFTLRGIFGFELFDDHTQHTVSLKECLGRYSLSLRVHRWRMARTMQQTIGDEGHGI